MSATEVAALVSPPRVKRKRSADPRTDEKEQRITGPAANPVLDGDAVCELEESLLYADLRCPICLCLMRDPVATD